MRFRLAFSFICMIASVVHAQKIVSVKSPDGQVQLNVTLSDKVYYDVISRGETLIEKGHLGMTLDCATIGSNPVMRSKKVKTVEETVQPLMSLKSAQIENKYTSLMMNMKGNYSVEWRVYDDGVAYRMHTNLKGRVKVLSEDFNIQLKEDTRLVLQQPRGFKTSCEEEYTNVQSASWKQDDRMSELPLVIAGKKQKMFVSEFCLFDYPGMFMKGNADNSLSAVHPQVPLEFGDDGDRSVKITKEADYIAETDGTRSYPWRYIHITADDKDMVCNTMPMRLAPASEIADPSWIRPGKTTWEWWNGSIPYGPDVNFKSGLNIETYKYFVDFAAANGLEYILMDEGWAKSTRDPFTPNPDIDLHELIDYAKSKNVGVILWLTWLTVENHPTMFETFEKWGVAGVKIDFMDRQDQWMVKFYERTAKAAAEHHIFVDYHGAYHPSGLEYKYPNVLTFEGVRGMEYMGGCTPRNSAYYPAIRNAAGPMDYTPGAMLCAQPDCFSSRRPNSASIGTRAYQMALYVVFESNLQMLADNPTLYNMYPDCRDYIASCPVNWDETRVLAAEFGEYTIVARRSGNKWYIGGITNETARDIDVKLDFLAEGLSYNATSFTDGINSSVQAMDYRRESTRLSRNSTIRIHMVRNGGYAAVLEP